MRLAQALMPLFDANEEVALALAQESINAYPATFQAAYFAGLRAKLGLSEARESDLELMSAFFKHMHDGHADFTLTFRHLADCAVGDDARLRAQFDNAAAVEVWLGKWRERISSEQISASDRAESMRRQNPLFIPRNHRIEAAIVAAQERGDFAPFEELLTVLSLPHDERAQFESYANPPRPDERVLQTFCGT